MLRTLIFLASLILTLALGYLAFIEEVKWARLVAGLPVFVAGVYLAMTGKRGET